jgi:hypothetical protein
MSAESHQPPHARSTSAQPTRSDEVPLSARQRNYLEREAQAGVCLKKALVSAVAFPGYLAAFGFGISRLLGRVAILGPFLLLWGIIISVCAGLLALVATPVIALILTPVVLFVTRRPKLRRDLEEGRALADSGSFLVSEARFGGAGELRCGTTRFDLTREQFDSVRPALSADDEDVPRLTGSVVHAIHSSLLLGVYDRSGHELVGPPR